MPSLGEFFVSLGFDVDDRTLKSFNSGIKDTIASVLEFGGIAATGAGFASLINGAANTATQLQNLSTQFGINQRSAQGWAAALHQFDPLTTFEQGLQSAQHVAKYINDMQTGRGGNELGQFGGGPQDNTLEKINARVRANYQRVVDEQGLARATQWISAIYGTASAVNALKQSTDDFNAAEANGIGSQDSLDKLAAYNNTMATLSNNVEKLKINLLSLPAEKLNEIFDAGNKSGILGAVGTFGMQLMDHIPFLPGAGMYGSLIKLEQSRKVNTNSPDATTGGDPRSVALSYFQSKGWTSAQSQGIVARLMAESGLNPGIYGHGAEAQGQVGEAYGAAQWHPDRQRDFESVMGRSIKGSSLQDQLAFVQYELTRGKYRSAGSRLRGADNARDAESIVDHDYERSAHSQITVHQINNFNGKYLQNDAEEGAQKMIDITRAQINLGPPK